MLGSALPSDRGDQGQGNPEILKEFQVFLNSLQKILPIDSLPQPLNGYLVPIAKIEFADQTICLVAFPLDPFNKLTNRQKDIFRLLAEGLSNKEIATRFGIKTGTVASHIARIFIKLKRVKNNSRTSLARYSILFS